MPANQAKEAVMDTPLKVILRAREYRPSTLTCLLSLILLLWPLILRHLVVVEARRAYKGVMSVPRMVMPETKVTESTTTMEIDQDEAQTEAESTIKRKAAEVEVPKQVKKVKAA
jgi:hypothetical protein